MQAVEFDTLEWDACLLYHHLPVEVKSLSQLRGQVRLIEMALQLGVLTWELLLGEVDDGGVSESYSSEVWCSGGLLWKGLR